MRRSKRFSPKITGKDLIDVSVSSSFAPLSIYDELAATQLKGRNLEFLTDLMKDQFEHLFTAAAMLEPFSRGGVRLMEGKVLCALFFQPSTRTRFSTELAMLRLGGTVISESNPAVASSAAKGESLADHLATASCYANIIGLRHPDYATVRAALPSANVPVISCGWGNETHPTQGLLDMYTAWRAFGNRMDGLKVCLASPDMSRGRAAHSFAMGLAAMGAHITYAALSEHPIPDLVMDKLRAAGADLTVEYDLTNDEFLSLLAEHDLCYLPGCCVPKDNPDARNDFMEKISRFYIRRSDLEKIKSITGKTVGLMHALPRNECEFDQSIDSSEFELYFKQMRFSVPLRMALVASMVGA